MGLLCNRAFRDEDDARATIETIVKKYTNDFKLFVRNRKGSDNSVAHKEVEFVLILLPSQSNGSLFDELYRREDIPALQTAIFLDEKSRQEKEAFYINTTVEVEYD